MPRSKEEQFVEKHWENSFLCNTNPKELRKLFTEELKQLKLKAKTTVLNHHYFESNNVST